MALDALKAPLFGTNESTFDEGVYAPIGGTGTQTPCIYLPGAEQATHTLDLWPLAQFDQEPRTA